MKPGEFDRIVRHFASAKTRRSVIGALLSTFAATADTGRTSAQFGEGDCSPGYTRCGLFCRNLSSDTTNCGGCGVQCWSWRTGLRCENGDCVCGYGKTRCGDTCVDVLSDSNNCGGCGVRCSWREGQRCDNGDCIGTSSAAPTRADPVPTRPSPAFDHAYDVELVGSPDWLKSESWDVSEDGAVVGIFTEAESTVRADARPFYWDGASVTDLAPLGMNDVGGFLADDEVAGWDADGNPVTFRATNQRVEPRTIDASSIPVPEGFAKVEVYGVNRREEAVGLLLKTDDGDLEGARGFLYAGGEVTVLEPAPGGTTSVGWMIDDAGRVLGGPANLFGRTFLYDALSGQTTDLGTLLGFKNSYPRGMNAAGDVVGLATMEPEDGSAPFLYDHAAASMSNLNDLIDPSTGWLLRTANDINDAGQIAGSGFYGAGTIHAFLLTPRS